MVAFGIFRFRNKSKHWLSIVEIRFKSTKLFLCFSCVYTLHSYVKRNHDKGRRGNCSLVNSICLNPIKHGIFFPATVRGGGGNHPPTWKFPMDYFWPMFLHASNLIYIRSSQKNLQGSSFKIVDFTVNQFFLKISPNLGRDKDLP